MTAGAAAAARSKTCTKSTALLKSSCKTYRCVVFAHVGGSFAGNSKGNLSFLCSHMRQTHIEHIEPCGAVCSVSFMRVLLLGFQRKQTTGTLSKGSQRQKNPRRGWSNIYDAFRDFGAPPPALWLRAKTNPALRTPASDSPMYLERSSGPLTERNLRSACPATLGLGSKKEPGLKTSCYNLFGSISFWFSFKHVENLCLAHDLSMNRVLLKRGIAPLKWLGLAVGFPLNTNQEGGSKHDFEKLPNP